MDIKPYVKSEVVDVVLESSNDGMVFVAKPRKSMRPAAAPVVNLAGSRISNRAHNSSFSIQTATRILNTTTAASANGNSRPETGPQGPTRGYY